MRPQYPLEFRQQMVELVRAGRSPKALAKEFEPSEQTIRNWVKQAELDTGQRTDGLTTEERAELRQLRRGRSRMSPSLLAAVLLIENRQLDSAAVSSQGAIGLMQVMPIHAGSYGCGPGDLTNVDTNICHGARILHLYMVRTRSVSVALRRYNGCVRGANTPRCHRYPAQVLRTAARLRRDILASATEADRHVRM